MLCEECGKNQASIHFTSVVNGHSSEKHLCESCMNAQSGDAGLPFTLSSLMSGFMGESVAAQGHSQPQDIKCEKCGMTYAMFKKGGLLGCASCYDAFSEQLTPIFKRLQAAGAHTGKHPSHVAPAPKEDVSALRQCDVWQEQLKAAVEQEDFERAAQLRDKIKQLKAEIAAKGEDAVG